MAKWAGSSTNCIRVISRKRSKCSRQHQCANVTTPKICQTTSMKTMTKRSRDSAWSRRWQRKIGSSRQVWNAVTNWPTTPTKIWRITIWSRAFSTKTAWRPSLQTQPWQINFSKRFPCNYQIRIRIQFRRHLNRCLFSRLSSSITTLLTSEARLLKKVPVRYWKLVAPSNSIEWKYNI